MKKTLVSIFLLIFGLCLSGCKTLVEYVSLSSIVKDENFNDAYIVTDSLDMRFEVKFDDLKEQKFYKNIMNSKAKPTDILPEQVPLWSLYIKAEDNELMIANLSDLYAKYNDKWYLIQCSKEDKLELHNYLLVEDETPSNDCLQIIRNDKGQIVFSVIALEFESCNIQYKDLYSYETINAENKKEVFDYLFEILHGRDSVYDYTNCLMNYSIEITYEESGTPEEIFNTYEFKFNSECCAMTILKNNNLIGTVILSSDEINVLLEYIIPRKEKTYKLTIQNYTDYELVGIKDEYKVGEEVEVKMVYEDTVVTYIHLNGENIGWLNGTKSVKFNMPAKDSELVVTYDTFVKNTFRKLFGYTIDSATQIIIDEGPGSIALPWCIMCMK